MSLEDLERRDVRLVAPGVREVDTPRGVVVLTRELRPYIYGWIISWPEETDRPETWTPTLDAANLEIDIWLGQRGRRPAARGPAGLRGP